MELRWKFYKTKKKCNKGEYGEHVVWWGRHLVWRLVKQMLVDYWEERERRFDAVVRVIVA